MARSNKSHDKLLELLQKKEANGRKISLQEILKATGWQQVTFTTYLSKGQLTEYINEVAPNQYVPSNSIGLTSSEFSRNLSQSKHRRELGYNCKSSLAKALLKKSHENMILALELYNRPSLENRLDSFVLCFSTSWEQLLKAILIERDGEKTIFLPKRNAGGIRETISLRECLKRYYDPANPIRKNIEKIAYYRDQAVHLLMPEIQGAMSRVFQSGVMNYGKAFQEFSHQPLLPTSHSGMLSLVGDLGNPSNATILGKYGEDVGRELLSLLNDLDQETQDIGKIEFAIPLNVKLVFAKDDDSGASVTLSKAEAGMEGLVNAIVVEKPTDRQKTHPFRQTEARNEINRRLKSRYSDSELEEYLAYQNSPEEKRTINDFDFQAIAYKLKWRNSDNSKHYLHKNPDTHYFSDEALEELITKIMDNGNYLKRARESFSHRNN